MGKSDLENFAPSSSLLRNVVPLILKEQISEFVEDNLIWASSGSGVLTTKKAYNFLLSNCTLKPPRVDIYGFPWAMFWKFPAPMRLLILIWRIKLKAISYGEVLKSLHLNVDDICPLFLKR